jgi:predicted dienelactone hydrolase
VQTLRRLSLAAVVLIAVFTALLVAAPAPARAAATPDPGTLGPFAVGHESFTVVDPTRQEGSPGELFDRELAVDVWYPVAPAQASGSFAPYSFQVLGLGFTSTVAREGAPPIPSVARPLIVFSHGSGGISVQSTNLCETLASHGFVVAAPNHTGNTAGDAFFTQSFPFAANARNRPRDVSVLIDRMIARTRTPGDRLYRVVNPYQIGVAGHSFGGFTALAVAGGYGDYAPDPRVRAIMPIAPWAVILPEQQIAGIRVPSFVLGGTLDTSTPLEPNSRIAFELPASRRVYRADVIGAGHSHFASVCRLGDVLSGYGAPLPFVTSNVPGYLDTCGPNALPIAVAERIQNFYAVSFFRRHLMQDTRYEVFLTEAWAQIMEPGVAFQRRSPSLPLF